MHESKVKELIGTSGQHGAETVTLTASCELPASGMGDPEYIMSVRCRFFSLNPGQEKVPLSPEGGEFGIPWDTGED